MSEAMAIVAKNVGAFSFTAEELYNKYCDLYTASYPVDASEVQDEEEDGDDDPEA